MKLIKSTSRIITSLVFELPTGKHAIAVITHEGGKIHEGRNN